VTLTVAPLAGVGHARGLGGALRVRHPAIQIRAELQAARLVVIQVLGVLLDHYLRLERFHHTAQPRWGQPFANAKAVSQPLADRGLVIEIRRSRPRQSHDPKRHAGGLRRPLEPRSSPPAVET
jgi:hypothetical protein